MTVTVAVTEQMMLPQPRPLHAYENASIEKMMEGDVQLHHSLMLILVLHLHQVRYSLRLLFVPAVVFVEVEVVLLLFFFFFFFFF